MRTITAILFVASLSAQAPIITTLCLSGCTDATLSAALARARTSRAATCTDHIIIATAGEKFAGESYDVLADDGSCQRYIEVRTSRYAELPIGRISPADAALMPEFVTGGDGFALRFGKLSIGASSYYRFVGVRFSAGPSPIGNFNNLYVGEYDIGNGSVLVRRDDQLPRNIDLDRVWLSNASTGALRQLSRNMLYNVRYGRVENSYMDGAYDTEAQAMGSCAARNLYIRNSFLRAPGENTLHGGCGFVIPIPGFRQYNIKYLGTHTPWKPEWYRTSGAGAPTVLPCYPGQLYQNTTTSAWSVCAADRNSWSASSGPEFTEVAFGTKNHNEVKDGDGVTYRGNVSEEGWQDGQQGQCVFSNAFATLGVRDLTYEYSTCDRTLQVASFGGGPSWRTKVQHIKSRNLRMPNSGGGASGTNAYKTGDRATDVTFRNGSYSVDTSNTGFLFLSLNDPRAWVSPPLTFDNVYGANQIESNVIAGPQIWPLLKSSATTSWCNWLDYAGTGGVAAYSHHVFAGTLFAGSGALGGCPGTPTWPADTNTAAAATDLFVDLAAGDLTLKAGAWKNSGPDGKDRGANIAGIDLMTAGAVSGALNPALDFGITRLSKTTAGTLAIDGTSSAIGTACTVTASTSRAFGTTTGTVSTTQAGQKLTGTISGLGSGVRWVRLACGVLYDDREVVL